MSLQTVDILWHGKEHTPSWARTHDLSITYRVPLIIVMSQILKAMHLKYIFIYQGLQTKKLYKKMTKIWIADVKWQPIWIFRFMEKRCHLQLGIRQKWIQHKKSYRNNKWSTFPQNAYRSISRAIFQVMKQWYELYVLLCSFQFFVLTNSSL